MNSQNTEQTTITTNKLLLKKVCVIRMMLDATLGHEDERIFSLKG